MAQLSYKPYTEEELRQMAQNQYAAGYENRLAELEQASKKQEEAYRRQLASLEPQYDKRAEEIAANLSLRKKELSDAALSRGFGRSSYVTDMLSKAHDDAALSLENLRLEQQKNAAALLMRIDELYDELYAQQGRLTQEKEQKILSQIDLLRREQEQRRLEVDMFNLEMEQRKREQDALDAYRQAQLAQKETVSSSKSGGKASSSGSTISKGTSVGPVYTPQYTASVQKSRKNAF